MKVAFRAALAAASVLAAGQASAAVISPVASGINAADYATPYMTYTTIDQINTSRTSGYSGVGSLFVSYVSTATTGLGSICSGSLIGSGTVLTAAHCLSRPGDGVASIRFYLPSFGDRGQPGTRIFEATGFALDPGYTNATGLVDGNDMAAFTITGDTSAYDIYGLYLGDPLGQFTAVGTGSVGGPQGTGIGAGTASDFRKRVGSNLYEYYGDDVFSDSTNGVVLYDFDDGTTTHDVFGRVGGNLQTGIANEASSSGGDSGGPSFINGQIAAVTSFGITGGIYQGFCGGTGAIDPWQRNGSGLRTTNLGNCTNSSVGEIGGNTLVSYNIDFVQGYLNGTVAQMGFVPEPATWAMMLVGFGFVGGALRYRRRETQLRFAA